jgi:leucyl-tRNA synthetase
MRPGLKRTAGLVAVDIVAVGEEGSDKGLSLVDGKEVELTQFAANAVPGTPSYRFENVGG